MENPPKLSAQIFSASDRAQIYAAFVEYQKLLGEMNMAPPSQSGLGLRQHKREKSIQYWDVCDAAASLWVRARRYERQHPEGFKKALRRGVLRSVRRSARLVTGAGIVVELDDKIGSDGGSGRSVSPPAGIPVASCECGKRMSSIEGRVVFR